MKHPAIALMDKIMDVTDKITARAEGLRPHVSHLKVEGEVVTATVKSATKDTLVYEVSIHLTERRRRCSCEAHVRYRDTPCKHTVATAMVVRDILSLME